jgi:hypothetical protein
VQCHGMACQRGEAFSARSIVPAAAVEATYHKGKSLHRPPHRAWHALADQLCADLYPATGRPVEMASWRLLLVVVMQDIEGLTDPEVADAVRRTIIADLLRHGLFSIP